MIELARLDPACFLYLLEPQYQIADMHLRISEALRRLESGELTRLILCAPPRHGKTWLATVAHAAWYLGRHPEREVIVLSYNDHRAATLGRMIRDLVDSPGFREIFPGIHVRRDATAMQDWSIEGHGGSCLAAGVNGAVTGYGADLLIVDDPVKNWEEAKSALQGGNLEDWFRGVVLPRLKPGAQVIIVMTRWHRDDLVGRLMRAQADGPKTWEVLELTALSAEGEALWPEQFDAAALERTRAEVGESVFAAEYQQQPLAADGRVFEEAWFHRWPAASGLGPIAGRVISLDTASKDGAQNDYSAAVVGDLMANNRLLIRHVSRKRLQFPELTDWITQLIEDWNYDGMLTVVLVEDAASGISLLQHLRSILPPEAGAKLHGFKPTLGKVDRARFASAWLAKEAVLLPTASEETPWLYQFERELLDFPGGLHDDQVDAFTMLVLYLELHLAQWHQDRMDILAGRRKPGIPAHLQRHVRRYRSSW